MYVRIPVYHEPNDEKNPRTFALAQVRSVDNLGETVTVKIHDLNGCSRYYTKVFDKKTFFEKELLRCKPPKNTRVVTPDGIGTVIYITKDTKTDYYILHVILENNKIAAYKEKDIKADFTALDMDPAQMLMRYEFQNPSWFATRYIVSRIMHVLNNSIHGFKVISGCRVFLLPHQIVTIARCLEKSPVRYMLADEVGLGKTIEACSIIKIMQDRNPALRVLYILPDALIGQWQFELNRKFYITATLLEEAGMDDRHIILPISRYHEMDWNDFRKYDVLVVDETHNLLKDDKKYETIQRLSQAIENVLLLSATPIQARKGEYLRLLQLLDPAQYNDMPLDYFEELVRKQQELQHELFMLMGYLQEYETYDETVLNFLVEIAERLNDNILKSIVEGIDLSAPDMGKETAYLAAAYISEHYRLEKHIIRNRRALLADQTASRELVMLPYHMASFNLLYGEEDMMYALLSWLDEIKFQYDEFTVNIVQPVMSAFFSSPWALEVQISKLTANGLEVPAHIKNSLDRWKQAAESELDRVDELLDENPDDIKGRLLYCLDYLEQYTDLKDKRPFKVLVFTNYKETAEAFLKIARKRLGNDACAVFLKGMNSDELEMNAELFQTKSRCRLLVSDELGGEGRNFQIADILVHLDTPWTANALEQRIGRLDRLGRNKDKPVCSIVIYAQNTIEEQLISLWHSGLNIYEQSLSGLEIVTGEIEQQIAEALKDDVKNGLSRSLPIIQEKASQMREMVEEEQIFDMTAMMYRPLTLNIEDMLNMYQGKEDEIFAEAMCSWASQAGFHPNFSTDDEDESIHIVEFNRESFSLASGTNAFLVPPKWENYNIHKQVRRKGRITGTFSRSLAIKREDLLFYAPGDAIFDTIVNNAMTCYKGRVCAIEIIDAPFDYDGLVFTWNIEPNMGYLYKHAIDPVVLAQFRAFLPMEQIITLAPYPGSSNDTVTAEEMADLLIQTNKIRKARHLGQRENWDKGCSSLQRFMSDHPREIWIDFIKNARTAGIEQARQQVMDKWKYSIAKEEATRIVNAFLTSRHYFGYSSDDEIKKTKETYRAVLSSLKNFIVSLDSVIYVRSFKK